MFFTFNRQLLPLFLPLILVLMVPTEDISADPADSVFFATPRNDSGLVLRKVIRGDIRPKSVVHSGDGLFFAQNMMYRHTVTVYNRNMELLKTIPDRVRLSEYGHKKFKGSHRGAPVEAVFTHQGRYAWVSNYEMEGEGFDNPGADNCPISSKYDKSFVYQINTENFEIISVIEVGCVPKYLAATPNDQYVLVSNWCSGDLSIIDTQTQQEIRRISMGRYPRGIVVDEDGKNAYVSIMGSNKIAVVSMTDFQVSWIKNVGRRPRHLCIDSEDNFLYATLNSEGRVVKIDLFNGKVIKKIETGKAPRSMVITEDGEYLYVVNYFDNKMSKIRCSDMKVVQTVSTHVKPIGITYDPEMRNVWVACYPGSLMVFEDTSLPPYTETKERPLRIVNGPFLPRWEQLSIQLETEAPFFAYIPPPDPSEQLTSEELNDMFADANPDIKDIIANSDIGRNESEEVEAVPAPVIDDNVEANIVEMEVEELEEDPGVLLEGGPLLQKWEAHAQLFNSLAFEYVPKTELLAATARKESLIINPDTNDLLASADDLVTDTEALDTISQEKIPQLEDESSVLSGDLIALSEKAIPSEEHTGSIEILEKSTDAVEITEAPSLETVEEEDVLALSSPMARQIPLGLDAGPYPPSWDTVLLSFAFLDTFKTQDALIAAEELFLNEAEDETEESFEEFVPKEPDLTHAYQLIIGSFSTRANANQEVENFSIRGFYPIIIQAGEKTFRVSVMSFDNYEEATARKERLMNETNIASWVLKYRN